MSQERTEHLDKDEKKEIASTYNTLAGLLAGLSFTSLFFYIGLNVDFDITSGKTEAYFSFAIVVLLVIDCLMFLFASIFYSDSIKIAVGANLDVKVTFEELLKKGDDTTFTAFLLMLLTMALVTMSADIILGATVLIIEIVLFCYFMGTNKAQFHSKRNKKK